MIIFSPGPANISERVRKALVLPDICHRDSEFSNMLAESRTSILKVCRAQKGYRTVVLGGSGTLAIESIIAALGGYRKKILVISNGVYGERAAYIARHYKIPIHEVRLPWGVLPDLARIESLIKDKTFGALFIVHHETTTGLLNPLPEISHIAKRYRKLVLVDGVSSIGGEKLDVKSWGIDAIAGSANKCIRGVPGIGFTVLSEDFIRLIQQCKTRSFYADLLSHLRAEDLKQPLFTPPVQVFYAFREALRELLEEGINERIGNYIEISSFLRDGLKKLGIEFYLPEIDMSNTMTVSYMPKYFNYAKLYSPCKRKGYVIYASQGKLAKTTFRLGTVGLITKNDIAGFLRVLSGILRKRNS